MRAGQRGGLRSGPAANGEWGAALRTLRAGELRAAVASLAAVRAAWVGADEPRMLVRAARHYEGAVAECISCCVRTCVAAATVLPEARRLGLGLGLGLRLGLGSGLGLRSGLE